MTKSNEDIKEFEHQWSDKGRDVRILDFSPDVILVQIAGAYSANELRRIASFLDECEDVPDVDMKGVYVDE
jgi:hypothetical protein